MGNKLIQRRIEYLKCKLNNLIELNGTKNNEVLKCSQRLDVLICNAYKKDYSKDNY